MEYVVNRAVKPPCLRGEWDDPVWQQANELAVANFRPESTEHRPQVSARLLYDAENIYGIFRVKDRYVRSVRTHYGDPVCKDSCVEMFVQPKRDRG